MICCVDTNVLLRSVHKNHPQQAIASRALAALISRGDELCVFPQNVREFWNVATRPVEANGLGFSDTQAKAEVERITRAFKVLNDGLPVYHEWLRLIAQHQARGVQAHDCYLAASVRVRKVDSLLTFNTADFTRYGITTKNPTNV